MSSPRERQEELDDLHERLIQAIVGVVDYAGRLAIGIRQHDGFYVRDKSRWLEAESTELAAVIEQIVGLDGGEDVRFHLPAAVADEAMRRARWTSGGEMLFGTGRR